MKIVLFSPMITTSAIGRVSALLVPELLARHELTVVRIEKIELLATPTHACAARLLRWDDTAAVQRAIDEADALVYQIGNHFDFHAGGVHWLERHPGIVCLHDFVVAHLFAGWGHHRPEEARRILCSLYGEAVAQSYFSARDHREFIETASRDHPMTEWICGMAHGVISHSRWGMGRVMQSCAGPVKIAALPYDAPAALGLAATQRADDAKIHVLTVGQANPNKRIESVICAIGTSALLRQVVHYRLCGSISPRYALELSKLARSMSVMLTIDGETSDTALQTVMNETDIACCLRWPSLEAASATAIEALLYGKAVVVMDTGFYSDLPDSCVRKISAQDEVQHLRGVLEELATDHAGRAEMAKRGQAWAIETFTTSHYADAIESTARDTSIARPALDMAQQLGAMVCGWTGGSEILKNAQLHDALQIFAIDPAVRLTEPHS
ncbi:MAG: glycosyltransferase [Rhizobacter sp.]|nr:glycosyltransferase [Rhizobacter sp.]